MGEVLGSELLFKLFADVHDEMRGFDLFIRSGVSQLIADGCLFLIFSNIAVFIHALEYLVLTGEGEFGMGTVRRIGGGSGRQTSQEGGLG